MDAAKGQCRRTFRLALQEASRFLCDFTAAPGKRDELMSILIDGTRDMPGCFGYIVAKDSVDENVVWVTET